MPNLKYPELFQLNASEAFDVEHAAGARAPYPGIYRCPCGQEAAVGDGQALPSEPHPLHPEPAPIVWRLVAAARRNVSGAAPLPPSNFVSPPGWPPQQG